MRRISPTQSGIAVGSVVGIWHLMWVVLVGLAWAKPVLDFVLRLHFIQLDYALLPYNVTSASALVVVTFGVGAIIGVIFALIWNWLTFGSAPAWELNGPKQAPAE